MENVQIIGTLVVSGLAVISSALVAIIPPLYNHKKTKQYDKQWEVLAELYKWLADADLDISIFLSPVQYDDTKDEVEKKASESFNSFARYYLENKIYIPENICLKIDTYLMDVKSNLSANMMARNGDSNDPGLWYKTWEKHQKGAIKESKDEIEQMFREYLKIKNEKAPEPKGKAKK